MPPNSELLDCVVIGGGPAGLTAAVYLARFRRTVQVIDANASRLDLIPRTHNCPGFPHGIVGTELLQRFREHAACYEIPVHEATVDRLKRLPGGGFEIGLYDIFLRSRTAILATGVKDVVPPFAGMDEAARLGCLRYCPVCDGYEAVGKDVVVMGSGEHGVKEALFIRHFARCLTLLIPASSMSLDAEQFERLRSAGVDVVHDTVSGLRWRDGCAIEVCFDGQHSRCFDMLYSALGLRVNAMLATSLGAKCEPSGELTVDSHMQTSVDGLYAIGDVVVGLNQISVATGQAAIAATAIHNRLGTVG